MKPSPPPMDLKSRTIKSAAWYAGTRVWAQGVSWIVTIVLARFLPPRDYGLFAMALAVISFLDLFQQLGLGTAIVQSREITQRQLNTVFWILVGVSGGVLLLSIPGANLAAWFYGEPRLLWMVRVLAFTFLLNALGTVPYNLLTKEIEFRKRSLAEALGVITRAAVTLALAYLGYGAWALVYGQLARTAVQTVSMAVAARWVPGLRVAFGEVGDLVKFGLRLGGSSAIGTLREIASVSIIGRALGGAALGLFSMADALGTTPLHKLSTSVINQLSLPVFCKLQRNDPELRKYFLKITKYLAIGALPMQIGMFLVAYDMVSVMLSAKWLPMVGLLQVFCLGGVFDVLPLPSAPLLTARGRAQTLLRFSWLSSATLIGAYLVGTRFGLTGVAVAWIITFPLLRILLLRLCLKEAGITGGEYLANIATPVGATVIMTAGVLLGQVFGGLQYGSAERLITEVAAGAFVYIAALLMIDRTFVLELRTIVRELAPAGRA